jgi:hypothetical protein
MVLEPQYRSHITEKPPGVLGTGVSFTTKPEGARGASYEPCFGSAFRPRSIRSLIPTKPAGGVPVVRSRTYTWASARPLASRHDNRPGTVLKSPWSRKAALRHRTSISRVGAAGGPSGIRPLPGHHGPNQQIFGTIEQRRATIGRL